MHDVLTTREVAERLGVLEWEIENAIRRREISRPQVIGRTRLWSSDDVESLRAVLAKRGRETEAAAK